MEDKGEKRVKDVVIGFLRRNNFKINWYDSPVRGTFSFS